MVEKKRDINFTVKEIDIGSVVGLDRKDVLKIQRNRIFVDVGNCLQIGAIDHHHRQAGETVDGTVCRSATKLVTACQDLILNNIDKDASEVEIIMHRNPDFDCFASYYLAKHLIEFGRGLS
jgi:hypothetical protein